MKRTVWGASLSDAGLTAVSGLLLTVSFPKLDWEFMAWVALVPFFHAIKNKSPSGGLKLGFFMGLVHYLTLFYWIAGVMETYGHLPIPLSWCILLLLVVYLSLYPAVFALLVCQLRARSAVLLWSAPFLWPGLEYVRAFLLSGFPWENLGYSQYNRLHLIQISDILGVYGLSALIVAVNATLFELWDASRERRAYTWKPILAVGLAVIGFLSYGAWRMARVQSMA